MLKSPLFLYLLWYLDDINISLLDLQYTLSEYLDEIFMVFRISHFLSLGSIFTSGITDVYSRIDWYILHGLTPSRILSFSVNNISLLWDIFSTTWEIIMWYPQRDSHSLLSHSMTISSRTCSSWDFNIHSRIYCTLDFLILGMRFIFHMLWFIFFRNYMDLHNPFINCIFYIHLFHLAEI